MIQMRPSAATSAVVNYINQFYDAGPGVTQTTMLGATGSSPALFLDFTTGQNLDPRITFTRASTGTYFDSAGVLQSAAINVPRLDYNPSTLAAQGLLIEEQRTNLRTYSDEIIVANAYQTNNATLSTVAISTPTGTAASTLVLNAGANTGNNTDGFNFSSGITLTNSTAYAQSVFAKSFGSNVLRLRSNVSGIVVSFTLTGNGTAPSATSDLTSAAIQNVGNGWYRCSWTFTTTTGAPGNRGDYWTIKTDVANGVNGIYVTGAQLEAGAFATSYIPTTAAAATRNADVASITGSNFSSFYNQSAWTVYAEYAGIASGSASGGAESPYVFGFNNTGTAGFDGYAVRDVLNLTSRPQVVGRNGATNPSTSVVYGAYRVAGQIYKSAAAIDSAGLYITADAKSIATTANSVFGLDTQNQMLLGFGDVGGAPQYYLNGWLRRITYYSRRLSNAELQAITA